jgi:hypothetical protein
LADADRHLLFARRGFSRLDPALPVEQQRGHKPPAAASGVEGSPLVVMVLTAVGGAAEELGRYPCCPTAATRAAGSALLITAASCPEQQRRRPRPGEARVLSLRDCGTRFDVAIDRDAAVPGMSPKDLAPIADGAKAGSLCRGVEDWGHFGLVDLPCRRRLCSRLPS